MLSKTSLDKGKTGKPPFPQHTNGSPYFHVTYAYSDSIDGVFFYWAFAEAGLSNCEAW